MRPRGLVRSIVLTAVAALGIVAFVVVLAVVVVMTQDFDRYRGDVADAVREATGRELTIGGKLDLQLSLRPKLSAREVHFANAPWGTRPDMLRFDLLEAEVSALPLLIGEVHVQRVVLSGAEIFLETDAAGHGNWLLNHSPGDAAGTPDANAAAAGEAAIPDIHNVVLRQVTIAYRDGLSGHESTLVLDELGAIAPDGAERLSLAAMGQYEGRPFNIFGTAGSIASLAAAEEAYPIDVELEIGKSSLAAVLEVALAEEPPVITGRLFGPHLRDVDLPFLASPGARQGALIDDEPLMLSGLRAVDIGLDVEIDRLESGRFVFEEVAARLVLEDGRLMVSPLTAKVADGAVAAVLDIDGGAEVPAVEMSLAGRQVEIGVFLDEFTGGHLFEGATDLDFSLAGAGDSTRAIATTLHGQVSAVMGEGRVENEELRLLAGDLLTLIDPWAAGIDSDRINCIVLRFDVAEGTASSKAVLLDAEGFIIGGGGTLGLGADRIDLTLDPRPKSEGLLSVTVPVKLSGQLSDPDYSTDVVDAFGAIVATVVGYATLPLTALADAVAGPEDVPNACLAAGAASDDPTMAAKSAIRRAVEGLGRKIKSLFR